MIVCRETGREAQQYHAAILDAADRARSKASSRVSTAATRSPERLMATSTRALEGNIQIIGSPEHLVDKLVGLKRAGCDGIRSRSSTSSQISSFFAEAVVPLMHQPGLRV